jgi:hypothetical protein
MGLAWTYVGFSKAFSAFTGWSEVVCGVLLLFRKTNLMGSLLSLAVMGNVVVINFCFDVPVKLFSSMLELMALYLAWPYLKKVVRFFTAGLAFAEIKNIKKYGDGEPKVPLYGIYTLLHIEKNHTHVVPLVTDTTVWKQFIILYKSAVPLKLFNDNTIVYKYNVDTVLKHISFYGSWDTVNRYQFRYSLDTSILTLHGSYKTDSLFLRYKRTDEKDFMLMNRGFHWINEYPFNR